MKRMEHRDGKTRRRAAGALAAATLAWLAAGAVRADDYEVEVIVFRHTVPQAAGAWASDEALPDFTAARRLAEPDDAAPAVDPATGIAPGTAAFTALPPSSFRLAGAEKLLAASTAYELVAHAAWQQPGDAGVAVYIGDPAWAGDASATVAPGAIDADGAPAIAPPRPRAEGSLRLQVALPEMRVQSDFVVLAGDTPVRVKATRNVKSGELHYLDHELLGILLQVTSLAPESPAEGEIVAPNADVPEEEFSD
ncbi:MAG: CsiV family protein [Gammaproteobacteria bacterium]